MTGRQRRTRAIPAPAPQPTRAPRRRNLLRELLKVPGAKYDADMKRYLAQRFANEFPNE